MERFILSLTLLKVQNKSSIEPVFTWCNLTPNSPIRLQSDYKTLRQDIFISFYLVSNASMHHLCIKICHVGSIGRISFCNFRKFCSYCKSKHYVCSKKCSQNLINIERIEDSLIMLKKIVLKKIVLKNNFKLIRQNPPDISH